MYSGDSSWHGGPARYAQLGTLSPLFCFSFAFLFRSSWLSSFPFVLHKLARSQFLPPLASQLPQSGNIFLFLFLKFVDFCGLL
jgi:hypothetical protein